MSRVRGVFTHRVVYLTTDAMPSEKLERTRAIIAKGLTVREVAIRLKVGKTTLYQALRAASA